MGDIDLGLRGQIQAAEFEAGKLLPDDRAYFGLDVPEDLFPTFAFQRLDPGIGGTGNKSATGLLLDAIGKSGGGSFGFHGSLVCGAIVLWIPGSGWRR